MAGGTTSGTAVYNGQPGPAEITNAGGLSAYGTMAQSGNVFEWAESGTTPPNDSAGETRVLRGGNWFDSSGNLASSSRLNASPSDVYNAVGFRVAAVAAVPEPSAFILTLLGMMGFVMRRKR